MMTPEDDLRLYLPRKFNATTKARFFRHRRGVFTAMVGGNPDPIQHELIERIIRNSWDLLKQDAQLDSGELSDHTARHRFAAENRLRLDLVALRKQAKPVTANRPPLRERLMAALQPVSA